MKELNLENYGVVEMKQQEMVETLGGGLPPWIIFTAGAIAGGAIYDAWKWCAGEYIKACGEGVYDGVPHGK